MGIQTIEQRICDKCGRVIKGRLIVHTCPCCKLEICNRCQTSEDARHKPKVKKESRPSGTPEPPPVTPGLATESIIPIPGSIPSKTEGRRKKDKKIDISQGVPDISTFELRVASDTIEGGYTPNQMSMAGISIPCVNLKLGALKLLGRLGIDQKYVEDAPDSQGKRELLAILTEEKKGDGE